MKKAIVVTVGLIGFSIFIAGINVKCNDRRGDDRQGIFKINGWVAYAVNQDKKEKYLWGRLDADLIQDSGYSIVEIKLNNVKFNFHHDPEVVGDYEIFIKPFELAVGDTLELAVGIFKKGDTPDSENIKYHVVASFRVNNLYKNVIYPVSNQMVDLNQISGPNLKIRWKFSDFLQPSIVNIMEGDKKVTVKEVNEDLIVLDKKIFNYDSLYKIEIGAVRGPDHHFSFTGVVAPDSELTFSHTYTIRFQIEKRAENRK